LKRSGQEPEVLILGMRKVLAMDATGLNALEDLYERLHRRKKRLILSGPHTQPLFMMDKAGFLDQLGRENICVDLEHSLERAREMLGLPPAVVSDPLRMERERIETARRGLAEAVERAGKVLNEPGSTEGPK
jgi:SulP family sulfate permease